jgi:hypothetical protein
LVDVPLAANNYGGRLAMSSFDRMLGWLPDTRREWIEVIIAAGLLMITAITDPELLSVG